MNKSIQMMIQIAVILLLGIQVLFSINMVTHCMIRINPCNIRTNTLTNHLPIDLESDADLAGFIGKKGNGTPSDPYIISNLSIQANGDMYCICIRNVDKNLIISGCYLSRASGNNTDKAIQIEACQNITITRCIINSCTIGINVEISPMINISSNQITDAYSSIVINNSNNCIVEKNTCDNGDVDYDTSIIAIHSNNLTIDDNTVRGGYDGIYIYSGYRVQATNNVVSDVYFDSVYLSLLTNSSIVGNKVLNGRYSGYYMNTLVNSTVTNNYCNKSWSGFSANGFKNSTIANNTAEFNEEGIVIADCIDSSILDNIIKESSNFGMEIYRSTHDTFSLNQMTGCGVDLQDSFDNLIDSSNFVNLKELLVFERSNNMVLSSFLSPGQVLCINCTNTSIVSLDCSQGGHGLLLSYCKNMSVSNCSFQGNQGSGIDIESTSECMIDNTNCTGNGHYGIELYYSNYITITKCDISNSENGVSIQSSSVNYIKNNIIHNNKYNGITLGDAFSNQIESNSIYQNQYGLGIFYSSNNVIDHDNISYNAIGILAEWDEGYGYNTISWNIFAYNTERCMIINEDVNNVHNNTCITAPETIFPIAVGMACAFLCVAVILLLYSVISKRNKLRTMINKRPYQGHAKSGQDIKIFDITTLYKVIPASVALAIAGMFVLPLAFMAGGARIGYSDCSGSFSPVYVLWFWGFYSSWTGWNNINYIAPVCYHLESFTDSQVVEAFNGFQLFTFFNFAVILAFAIILLFQARTKKLRFLHASIVLFNSYILVTGSIICLISIVNSFYPSPYGLLLVGLAVVGIIVRRSLHPSASTVQREIEAHKLKEAQLKYEKTLPRCTSCNEPVIVENFVAHKGLCDTCFLRRRIKFLKLELVLSIALIPFIAIIAILTSNYTDIFVLVGWCILAILYFRMALKDANKQYKEKLEDKDRTPS
ncbi:MAG TPA: right-handed parallel beta-helix repeat-containing protein [Candidatus Lokiarchaeia archaeon]|nr:right-handed parallel beta-helix repeat-containing protein [Candidatus Lokiarchaeia archaeon]